MPEASQLKSTDLPTSIVVDLDGGTVITGGTGRKEEGAKR